MHCAAVDLPPRSQPFAYTACTLLRVFHDILCSAGRVRVSDWRAIFSTQASLDATNSVDYSGLLAVRRHE